MLQIFYGVLVFIGWVWGAAFTYHVMDRMHPRKPDEPPDDFMAIYCFFVWPFPLVLFSLIGLCKFLFRYALKDWSAVFKESKITHENN